MLIRLMDERRVMQVLSYAVIDYFDKLYSHQNDAGSELLDDYEKQNVGRIRNIVLS